MATSNAPHIQTLLTKGTLIGQRSAESWDRGQAGQLDAQRAITETRAHAGNTVIEAADGATAIMAIMAIKNDAERLDAVVLDYRLPDSNDLALLASVPRLSPGSARHPDDRIRNTGRGERRVRVGRLPRAAQTIRDARSQIAAGGARQQVRPCPFGESSLERLREVRSRCFGCHAGTVAATVSSPIPATGTVTQRRFSRRPRRTLTWAAQRNRWIPYDVRRARSMYAATLRRLIAIAIVFHAT